MQVPQTKNAEVHPAAMTKWVSVFTASKLARWNSKHGQILQRCPEEEYQTSHKLPRGREWGGTAKESDTQGRSTGERWETVRLPSLALPIPFMQVC